MVDSMGVLASCARAVRVGLTLAVCLGGTCADARHHHRNDESPAVAGQFDYYLLSMSWSPSYCLIHPQARAECEKGYGFVLHGLWPQFSDGDHPEDCATGAVLTTSAWQLGRSLYPSSKLIQHEWDRHGTCSGLSAVDYFRSADRAAAVLQIPAQFQAPRTDQTLALAQIATAFYAANPRLPTAALSFACSRGTLSEVRVCLDRELAPMPCARGVHNSCPLGAISIPAAH